MNYRIFLVTITFFVATFCYSQNSYVEVTVNDTILAKADQFLYRLNFTQDMTTATVDTVAARSPNYYLKRAEEMREKQKLAKEEWQTKIKNAGFTIMPPNLSEAFLKNNYENNAVFVFITSIDSLIHFYSLIKN